MRKQRIREVPAVSRAIAILRLLGNSPDPMGITTIAKALSLVPSTCLHILRVLVAEGLVKVDGDSKRYTLDSGMLSLARSVIERSSFAGLVQPALDRMAQAWSVTTMGVEIQNDEYMVVLALSRSTMPFALRTDVGRRFPALVSATGRLYAAFGGQSWPQLRKRFAALRWSRPIDFVRWKAEVEMAGKQGFSVDRGHYINGVTVVSVPLLGGSGKLERALVGVGLSEHLDPAKLSGLVEEMRQEARRLATLVLPSV